MVELFLRPWYAPLRAYSIGEPVNGQSGGSVASVGEPELLTERVAGYDVPEDSAAAEAGDGDLLPKVSKHQISLIVSVWLVVGSTCYDKYVCIS